MCHSEQQVNEHVVAGDASEVETVGSDPRQQIGTDLLDSIREKAIDSANAKVDEFCRGVAAAIGRLLGESALSDDGAGLTNQAKSVLYAMMDAGVRMAAGNWRFRDFAASQHLLIERETRRITDAIASAAANSVVPGQCCNLTLRVDAAHVENARCGRGREWQRKYNDWIKEGVHRGVLVDLTA